MEKSNKVLNLGENQAEEALLWWKEEFKEDFYIGCVTIKRMKTE
jgi:DNA polymerase-3 subunit alpha